MKRDMSLIRQIALQIEDATEPMDSNEIVVEGYSPNEIGYHCALMDESGLIVAHSTEHLRSEYPEFRISRLSTLGHDFVDAARNDTLWRKAMDTIKSTVGGVSVDLLIVYLKRQASSVLGIGSE